MIKTLKYYYDYIYIEYKYLYIILIKYKIHNNMYYIILNIYNSRSYILWYCFNII